MNCAGDYTISDLSISNNTVNCSSSESRGIFVTGVNNSEIVSNRLTDYASAENGINAVNTVSYTHLTLPTNSLV